MLQHSEYSASFLMDWMARQRRHTLNFIHLAAGDGNRGPHDELLNPPLWEWCHLIWFWEFWCLRYQGPTSAPRESLMADADRRFNSALIAHDARWHCELPTWTASLDSAQIVMEKIMQKLATGTADRYFIELALHHEAMHEENFMRRAQLLAQPFRSPASPLMHDARVIAIPDQTTWLGAKPNDGFIFDNEKWQHETDVKAYSIASMPVSETEYAEFVQDGGYLCDEWWSVAGKNWRRNTRQPLYWQIDDDGKWQLRDGQSWRTPDAKQAMRYINLYEAEAYAAYRHARLPSAAQWHLASAQFIPQPLWEWTADRFKPYPGFTADPYAEYSAPSFDITQELRGASPLLQHDLARAGFRNFFAPQRRDICAGLRLCWSV